MESVYRRLTTPGLQETLLAVREDRARLIEQKCSLDIAITRATGFCR